jgi:hypothetical protein
MAAPFGVPFQLLVGGWAVILYGHVRATDVAMRLLKRIVAILWTMTRR